jgi:hypothetical protein
VSKARKSTGDLDPNGVLAMCAQHSVPVNAFVGVTIAAHRIAFRDFQGAKGDEPAKKLAMCALRAIILARTPKVRDYRLQLDYLSTLPLVAWEDAVWGPEPPPASYPAETMRQETLAMIEHQLKQAEKRE